MTESHQDIRAQVREGYGAIAAAPTAAPSCCGGAAPTQQYAKQLGYSDEELAEIPEEANLGLSCGNPTAIAAIQPGEVVVDLGSGAGMDAFLAAKQVTSEGRVIGVDMTPEMLKRARELAVKRGVADFVEFREGVIEELPIVSGSVDVILSNCVINLSPDKERVFQEAFRVLKPGGRLAVSDILLTGDLPDSIRERASLYIACISGALLADTYLGLVRAAGFTDVKWTRTSAAPILESACCDAVFMEGWEQLPTEQRAQIIESIWSYRIEATKPCDPSPAT